jgi:hypothetical protein
VHCNLDNQHVALSPDIWTCKMVCKQYCLLPFLSRAHMHNTIQSPHRHTQSVQSRNARTREPPGGLCVHTSCSNFENTVYTHNPYCDSCIFAFLNGRLGVTVGRLNRNANVERNSSGNLSFCSGGPIASARVPGRAGARTRFVQSTLATHFAEISAVHS